MKCDYCNSKLVCCGFEAYCPVCGLVVEEEYDIDFRCVSDFGQCGYGFPCYPFEANEQQTEKLIKWKNRTMIILLPPHCLNRKRIAG